ncbi:HU family DNA-binding protein [Methylobacillus sp. Pita2]|uniref:HU family DNA-binding protein n=1 Tax=Methylobacillus sp. Pita2 TaxID=3383245 RepID=UPI0038B5355E
MTKNELAIILAQDAGISTTSARLAIDSFTSAVTKALRRGEEIRITGFGAFNLQRTKARLGRNPKTGERIKLPASNRVVFKIGSNLKTAINT